jgi:CheY-like chemotaxis protein
MENNASSESKRGLSRSMKSSQDKDATRHILWVDDDRYATHVILNFEELRDYRFHIATNATEAFNKFKRNAPKFCAVILDVMMPPGDDFNEVECFGGYHTGVVLARRMRELEPTLPILVVTGIPDSSIHRLFAEQSRTAVLLKPVWPKIIFNTLLSLIDQPRKQKHQPRMFVVHGHDNATKLELMHYLQNTLKLGHPIVLHEQANAGKTIIEKFEANSLGIEIVFVLLTPDDSASSTTTGAPTAGRTRQNVIFELGYFYGLMQRTKGHVILLYKGDVELPSDIHGIAYIDITNGIESAGEEIRRELSDWL